MTKPSTNKKRALKTAQQPKSRHTMSNNTIIYALALTAILTACNSPKPEEKTEEKVTEHIDSITNIIRKEPFTNTGTVAVKDTEYSYVLQFSSCDSLPVVTNAVGQKYYDNTVTLTISKGADVFYKHTFTKSSFSGMVPSKFMETSALVGFNFNYNKEDDHSAFYFIATVGDPDDSAEMSFPLEVAIGTDKSLSIKKAENLDTEPVHKGLTKDPAYDEGV